jgi:coenzyme PQQ precursor peptide PqqA
MLLWRSNARRHERRLNATVVRRPSAMFEDSYLREVSDMIWVKPEFEVVDVTMEITAYVARR